MNRDFQEFAKVLFLLTILTSLRGIARAQNAESRRPYEMVWAHRTEDIHPPLVGFENSLQWKVTTVSASATFSPTEEVQLWGEHVGKLTYRALGDNASLRVLPPAPIPIKEPWDTFWCWIKGNNIFGQDLSTPPVSISMVFINSHGEEIDVPYATVNWEGWFVPYHKLSKHEQSELSGQSSFDGFRVSDIRNKQDRVLYFDNFATFVDKMPPLNIPARPQRGIPMLPGEGVGFNTGEGKLSFPTTPETILPGNGTKNFTTKIRRDKSTFVFEYRGDDGNLTYRLTPKTGTWSDITARWNDGNWFNPLADGGIHLWVGGKAVMPQKIVPKSTFIQGDKVVSSWTASADGVSQEVVYTYHLWNKSLIIDTISKGGNVAEVDYGHADGIANPRLMWNPFMTYNSLADRPGVVVMGTEEHPLFLMGNTDWYLSNASTIWGKREIDGGQIFYNGGTRYIPKTDGKRNDCYERFFVTIAPKYGEVLPNIPNPVSPWKKVTATHAWTVRPSSPDRQSDYDYFKTLYRYGIRDLIVTDHETMWRDGNESFTYRTKTAPGKGGDEAEAAYAHFLQNKLGYIYGSYNQFHDIAPVNKHWTPGFINRESNGDLQDGWYRCFVAKPIFAVSSAAEMLPVIQNKFHFGAAYADLITNHAPWTETDYDARVPGAGTFANTFYAYGELLDVEKKTWNGPVYSEGTHQWLYAGLADGNYGQDAQARLYENPWLVDFDLRKIHPLENDFGMGYPKMFWAYGNLPKDLAGYDQYFAAAVAFGHTSYLIPTANGASDLTLTLRSYYMPLALHSHYGQSTVKTIQYAGDDGRLYTTSQAVENGVYKRSQIVTHYQDGTVTVVNGNGTDTMRVEVDNRRIVLPPYGYTGWTSNDNVYVFSGDMDHHRADYSVNEKYFYVDGRGKFTRFPKAASDGQAICLIQGNGKFEIIPLKNADCGFAITATSVTALDKDGKEIGPAQTRVARGLTYIIPVKNVLSYSVKGSLKAPQSSLSSAAVEVFPGQVVKVSGSAKPTIQIPANAKPGAHLWLQERTEWIDFQVNSLTNSAISVKGNSLTASITNNLPRPASFDVSFLGDRKVLLLQPGEAKTVSFELPKPQHRESTLIALQIDGNGVSQSIPKVLLATQDKTGAWEYSISDNIEQYARVPGPFPIGNITLSELRDAKSGWLHYQGIGLNGGTGQWSSYGILNGCKIGPMASAGGKPLEGI